MTCVLFCEHQDTLLDESNFSLDVYAFVNLQTFSSFLSQIVLQSFFFSKFDFKYFQKIQIGFFN